MMFRSLIRKYIKIILLCLIPIGASYSVFFMSNSSYWYLYIAILLGYEILQTNKIKFFRKIFLISVIPIITLWTIEPICAYYILGGIPVFLVYLVKFQYVPYFWDSAEIGEEHYTFARKCVYPSIILFFCFYLDAYIYSIFEYTLNAHLQMLTYVTGVLIHARHIYNLIKHKYFSLYVPFIPKLEKESYDVYRERLIISQIKSFRIIPLLLLYNFLYYMYSLGEVIFNSTLLCLLIFIVILISWNTPYFRVDAWRDGNVNLPPLVFLYLSFLSASICLNLNPFYVLEIYNIPRIIAALIIIGLFYYADILLKIHQILKTSNIKLRKTSIERDLEKIRIEL